MTTPKELIEQLRSLDNGTVIDVTTDDGETHRVFTVDKPEYEEPDEYGSGWLSVHIEVDTETHEVLTEIYPTESGDISASNEYISMEWERPTLTIWDPVVEDTEIIEDDWKSLGWVTDVEVVD